MVSFFCCWQWALVTQYGAGLSYFRHCEFLNSDTSGNVCISCILNMVKVISLWHLRLLPGLSYFQILMGVSANCWYDAGLHVVDSCSVTVSSVTVSLFHGVMAEPVLQQVWVQPLRYLHSAEAFMVADCCVHIFHVKKCALVFYMWQRDSNFLCCAIVARYCYYPIVIRHNFSPDIIL